MLSADEEKQLKQYITDILSNDKSNIHTLSGAQLGKLMQFVGSLENELANTDIQVVSEADANEPTTADDNDDDEANAEAAAALNNIERVEFIPLTSVSNAQPSKKDIEKFKTEDMGAFEGSRRVAKDQNASARIF